MEQGGNLRLSTANVELNESYASKYLDIKPGSYAMLSISDSGKGMDEEVKSRVFEPFFTTKDVGKGTGLGLSTAWGIVRQSGGTIEIYSKPGSGTTFRIYFPVVDDEIEELQKPSARLIQGRGGTETILVCEDDPSVRNLTCKILQRLGYRVLEAALPADAIETTHDIDEVIHLLLTDVVMPEMRGNQLAERLMEFIPELKTVFMSGYSESMIQHDMMNGAAPFIQKPFTADSLARKVREVLDSG